MYIFSKKTFFDQGRSVSLLAAEEWGDSRMHEVKRTCSQSPHPREIGDFERASRRQRLGSAAGLVELVRRGHAG
jgi:hypothetical protein